MELKILCLLVIVGVLSAETKILKAKLVRKMPQVNDKLMRGVPQVNDKLMRGVPKVDRKQLRGMPQVNRGEGEETNIDTSYERFFNFYRYKAPSSSSSVAPSSINTCIATSRAPTTVTIGVYALRAARGTKFLRHRVKEECVEKCFENHRFENLTVKTFDSCADAVESSGWANSFSFVDDVCVGYAAWMQSKHTQGSWCDGNFLVFVAENQIHNITTYPVPGIYVDYTLSRIGVDFVSRDYCLNTAKVEVKTQLGSKTFDKIIIGRYYLFEQFNIALCASNPPQSSKTVEFTFYDYNGRVQWRGTVEKKGPKAPGTMHRFSGAYGDLCVQVRTDAGATSCSGSGETGPFQKTSFLSFAAYRDIISKIPGVPSHFVDANPSIHLGTPVFVWSSSRQQLGAEDFASGTIPAVGDVCLVAKSEQNYLLQPQSCSPMVEMVCVDFSALSTYGD